MNLLTSKGAKIKKNLITFYGPVKGELVFRAMIKEGKLTGVETTKKSKRIKGHKPRRFNVGRRK